MSKTNNIYQGYGSKGWWFTGAGSFISNGYVIYTNGLDGYAPNPIAVGQGGNLLSNLIDDRNEEKNAAFSKFISTLRAVADAQAAAEEKYLKLKLDQLFRSNTSGIEVSYLNKIQEAIDSKAYGAAYTLLLKRQKDLTKFRKEVKSTKHRSYAQTNEFFSIQFAKFLVPKFEAQLKGQRGADREIVLDTDFGELIDEYFSTALNVSVEDNQSLEVIRQSFIHDLENIRDASGGQIILSSYLKSDKTGARPNEDSAYIINSKTGQKKHLIAKKLSKTGKALTTKQGKYRTPRQIAEAWAAALAQVVGRGLGQEAYQIGAFGDIGARAFSTGQVMRDRFNYFGDKTVFSQQKEDIFVIDCFHGELDLNEVITGTAQAIGNNTTAEYYDELDQRLKNLAESNPATEIFELVVNVKGYISTRDLQIEGTGSFLNRVNNLQAANVNGVGEQLIFMLNNTAKGALMSGQEEVLADYIAATCVAWMWDKPEELFNLDLSAPANLHKVRLFNSGGAYFTASQIIYQTIAKLQGQSDNQFVRVGIKAPPQYSGYSALLNSIPNNGKNMSEWQSILKQRWDAVRQDAMENGALSIHFNQAGLNELLGNLTAILKAK